MSFFLFKPSQNKKPHIKTQRKSFILNIGYIRISSKDQNPQRQIEPIQNLTEKQYIDTQSGKDTNRPQLKEMLLFARKGDLIIVESISRFARNTKDLLELDQNVNGAKVSIIGYSANKTPILFDFIMNKDKDITSQKLLDESVILMDNERIEFKLQ